MAFGDSAAGATVVEVEGVPNSWAAKSMGQCVAHWTAAEFAAAQVVLYVDHKCAG